MHMNLHAWRAGIISAVLWYKYEGWISVLCVLWCQLPGMFQGIPGSMQNSIRFWNAQGFWKWLSCWLFRWPGWWHWNCAVSASRSLENCISLTDADMAFGKNFVHRANHFCGSRHSPDHRNFSDFTRIAGNRKRLFWVQKSRCFRVR